MDRYGNWLRRKTAAWLLVLACVPLGGAGSAFAQQPAPAVQDGTQASPPAAAPPAVSPAAATDTGAQQDSPQAPVGTAIAPYERGIGVAASRPAGVVIAPSKQKRNRSFLIKVGLLVGAAAAVGTVVALSAASPSTPH